MDLPEPIERALGLMPRARRPISPDFHDGYLDLLGDAEATGDRPGQRLMASRVLPLIYERAWRPLGGRLLMGAFGPSMGDERRMALGMLSIEPGATVLDVACGPGNFTRAFAGAAGDEGLTVGLDASRTMLAQAVREGGPGTIAYIRGDAESLPFRDRAFDAVCCFAALYLIEEPFRAIAEMARVLKPGGRVALLSSVNRGLLPAAATDADVRNLTGIRVFGGDQLTGALESHGLVDARRRIAGFAQFVSARRP
jgi:SAM-dependent methyltransferase